MARPRGDIATKAAYGQSRRRKLKVTGFPIVEIGVGQALTWVGVGVWAWAPFGHVVIDVLDTLAIPDVLRRRPWCCAVRRGAHEVRDGYHLRTRTRKDLPRLYKLPLLWSMILTNMFSVLLYCAEGVFMRLNTPGR
jgi:membrane protein YdbS with pleckstrin-like domain